MGTMRCIGRLVSVSFTPKPHEVKKPVARKAKRSTGTCLALTPLLVFLHYCLFAHRPGFGRKVPQRRQPNSNSPAPFNKLFSSYIEQSFRFIVVSNAAPSLRCRVS